MKSRSWFVAENLDFFHILPRKNNKWIKDHDLLRRHRLFMEYLYDEKRGDGWSMDKKADLLKIRVGDYDWIWFHGCCPSYDQHSDEYLFVN